MIASDKIEQLIDRFQFLEAKMADGAAGAEIATLGKEYADLRPVVETVTAYKNLIAQIADAQAMLKDPEMRELAEAELPELKAQLAASEHEVQLALLPKDSADGRPALLEIRPGTGGDEASLFAGDLLRMYQRYAEGQGWKFEILEESQTELGGIKEVVARVAGEGVFA
ncbi:MAG: PCRF domain-containing protein, partial [Paracoccaceae bacterium]|nr:PCRF domain-containing protein [Paracoccaceae bacterium]